MKCPSCHRCLQSIQSPRSPREQRYTSTKNTALGFGHSTSFHQMLKKKQVAELTRTKQNQNWTVSAQCTFFSTTGSQSHGKFLDSLTRDVNKNRERVKTKEQLLTCPRKAHSLNPPPSHCLSIPRKWNWFRAFTHSESTAVRDDSLSSKGRNPTRGSF